MSHDFSERQLALRNAQTQPGYWTEGALPANVRVGVGTVITDHLAFKRFHSLRPDALVVGAHCTIDGAHFDLGQEGRMRVGDYCYFTSTVLLCELEIHIGNYVVLGWNTTIADTDFHPLDPALRIEDAIAVSPLGKGRPRPPITKCPVVIEDDVWVGPNCTILKGVHIGAGAFIEAGSLVTHDVAPGAHIMGNPAQEIGGAR